MSITVSFDPHAECTGNSVSEALQCKMDPITFECLEREAVAVNPRSRSADTYCYNKSTLHRSRMDTDPMYTLGRQYRNHERELFATPDLSEGINESINALFAKLEQDLAARVTRAYHALKDDRDALEESQQIAAVPFSFAAMRPGAWEDLEDVGVPDAEPYIEAVLNTYYTHRGKLWGALSIEAQVGDETQYLFELKESLSKMETNLRLHKTEFFQSMRDSVEAAAVTYFV